MTNHGIQITSLWIKITLHNLVYLLVVWKFRAGSFPHYVHCSKPHNCKSRGSGLSLAIALLNDTSIRGWARHLWMYLHSNYLSALCVESTVSYFYNFLATRKNKPPRAEVFPKDQTITLPTSTIILDASSKSGLHCNIFLRYCFKSKLGLHC